MKNINIRISGQVQGVFFRANAQAEANRLGIKGTASNLPDKTVLIEVEGPSDKVNEFLKWCEKGPERAAVEKLVVTDGEIKNFSNFVIVQ